MTYEEILKRMLNRVPSTFDRREGSVIYDALSPAAKELELAYNELMLAVNNTFAGTANREWLINRCKEIGIAPYPATYAIRKGVFTPTNLEISIGERFNYEDLNFVVIEKIADGEYKLRCETIGSIGNYGEGVLIPIDYINGLATATLTNETIVYGEDEEETETLRQRYFDTLPTMTLDGNVAQYSKWCRDFPGIGNYKIFPEWNGKNTVKVSILSSENTVASQDLIDAYQEYLDPESKGLGMGKAPIGAIVTVNTATEKAISVVASVIYREGYDSPVGLEQDIIDYLHSLNYYRDTISYVAISSLFSNNVAIDLVVDVTVNGGKNNISLAEEEVAKLSSFTVTEA